MSLCEQKKSSEKQCLNLESVGAENQKQEHQSKPEKQPMHDGRRFSVYALIESGRIRYIGITSQPLKKRLYNHFADMKRPERKEHKTNWLRACKRDGLEVKIKPLRVNLLVDDAQRIERQIIKRLRVTLVNVHEGGSTGYSGLSEEAKKRHSVSGKARFLDPVQKEKVRLHSIAMNKAKAKKRSERKLTQEEQWQRDRRANILMKIITISDPRTGETNRLQIWNGKGARVNQVAVTVNGNPWKNLGKTRLAKGLAEAILR